MPKRDTNFWTLLNRSVIISGLLAIMLAGTVCYLAVIGQTVPDVLAAALATIVGFFFGAKKGRDEERDKVRRENV